MQLVNIEYLKQFRKEDVELPGQERLSREIYFLHFHTSRKQKLQLERVLGERITHCRLIGAIVSEVEREGLVANRQLAGHLRKLLKVFDAYRCREAEAAEYFVRLSAQIRRFMGLAEVCQVQTQSYLLNKVKGVVGRNRDDYFGSRDIRHMQLVLGKYLDIVCCNHDIFCDLLNEELNRTGAATGTSPVEAALFRLTTFLKGQMFSLEATLSRLGVWQKSLCVLEAQGVYN
jgi:hypothetical protein